MKGLHITIYRSYETPRLYVIKRVTLTQGNMDTEQFGVYDYKVVGIEDLMDNR